MFYWAALVFACCTGAWSESVTAPGQLNSDSPFASTVDWFKPVPAAFVASKRTTLYEQLITAIPHRLHAEAVRLLGNASAVELTKQRAKYFDASSDPDRILRARIHDDVKRLNQAKQSVIKLKGRSNTDEASVREARVLLEGNQWLIGKYADEIATYRSWLGRMKPYLLKAVTLASRADVERAGFSGELSTNDVLIIHPSAGNKKLPMKRMPVVVYLPMKPQHVYTAVTMVE